MSGILRQKIWLEYIKPFVDEWHIERAEWMTMERFFSKKRQVYPNILEVLHTQDTAEIVSKVQIKIK